MSGKIKLSAVLVAIFFAASPAGAQGSANSSAGGTSAMALLTAGGNAAMGAALIPDCTKTPPNILACIMAAQSFMQVGQTLTSGGSAKGVSQQFKASSNFGNGYNDLGSVNVGGVNYTPDELLSFADKNIEALKKKGYEVDPKTGTISTPKGKAPASALGSGGSLAASGLIDPSQAAEYDDILKKASQKISVVSGPGAGGGGAPASNRRPASSNSDYNFNFGLGQQPKAAKTAGLTKEFGSDQIGVATDNIFDMVSRRYQALDQKGYFIKGD